MSGPDATVVIAEAEPGTVPLPAEKDWDAIIDDGFGPLNRQVDVNGWHIVTGMNVKLWDVLQARTANTGAFVVFADTVDLSNPPTEAVQCTILTQLLVFARAIIPSSGAVKFHRTLRHREEHLCIGIYSPNPVQLHCFLEADAAVGTWKTPIHSLPFGADSGFNGLKVDLIESSPGPYSLRAEMNRTDLSGIPLEPLRALVRREVAAAALQAAKGEHETTRDLLARATRMATWLSAMEGLDEIYTEAASILELIEPLRMLPDKVPYLSPHVYAGVASAYSEPLKAYAATFERLADRAANVDDRRRSAQLILNERGDAIQFQALVRRQLEENLQKAKESTERAQHSIEHQQQKVAAAQREFESGLQKWKAEQERAAAMAIVSGIFSFAGGMASVFAGNAAGAADATKAAADVAKTASKLAELMKKLVKIAKVVEQLVKLCDAIYKAATKIDHAKQFAEQMSQATLDSHQDDGKEAPSAGAYWDQLWVEVETELQPAVTEKVDNAAEYLKELKVLVIYGRALTVAQAAIPPLVQEIARAQLQGEIARRQHAAVSTEVQTLQANQALSAQAMITLWTQYRGVQRAMLVALQSFDLAERYWALEDPGAELDTNRSILDLVHDLTAVADVTARQRAALEDFTPPPQDFEGEQYHVSPAELDAFLRNDSLAVFLSPGSGPFQGRGRVGRVRVREVRAWLEWKDNAQPTAGHVELTIRTNGVYDDQRVVNKKVKSFHFVGTPVNLTFRYDLGKYAEAKREASINTHAQVAETFRAAYSEPTLFTEWQVSLPKGGGGDTLDREALKDRIKGMTLEFSGSFIKDPDRFV